MARERRPAVVRLAIGLDACADVTQRAMEGRYAIRGTITVVGWHLLLILAFKTREEDGVPVRRPLQLAC